MSDGTGPGALNLAALTVGVTGIATVLGGLSLTGTVGRVIRNEPDTITYALCLVLLGGTALVLAGLPATSPRQELWLSVLGVELTVAGMLLAGVAGVLTSGGGERPAMTAELADGGRTLRATVKAGNMRSNARVVVIAYGVGPNAPNGVELHRADIGPDGDGKVDYVLDAPVAGGTYNTVNIASWPTRGRPGGGTRDATTTCDSDTIVGVARKTALPATDTACISLPLPKVATAPTVAATWQGTGGTADRLEVRVTATHGPPVRDVALVVKGRRHGQRKPLYRAVMQTDANGSLDRAFQVPVGAGFRRVCVGAAFLEGARFPSFRCHGGVMQLLGGDRTAIQLKLPGPAPATGTTTTTPAPTSASTGGARDSASAASRSSG